MAEKMCEFGKTRIGEIQERAVYFRLSKEME